MDSLQLSLYLETNRVKVNLWLDQCANYLFMTDHYNPRIITSIRNPKTEFQIFKDNHVAKIQLQSLAKFRAERSKEKAKSKARSHLPPGQPSRLPFLNTSSFHTTYSTISPIACSTGPLTFDPSVDSTSRSSSFVKSLKPSTAEKGCIEDSRYGIEVKKHKIKHILRDSKEPPILGFNPATVSVIGNESLSHWQRSPSDIASHIGGELDNKEIVDCVAGGNGSKGIFGGNEKTWVQFDQSIFDAIGRNEKEIQFTDNFATPLFYDINFY